MSGTVLSWGRQIIPYVEPESRFTQIATGGGHNLGLKSDGTVVAWGSNGAGESQVPHDLGKVVAVAAADSHTLALRTDGTVVAWGQVWNGLIWVPATVASNLGNVIAIATGVGHSLALKSDGTVVAWGWNEFGQTTVPENLSGVIAIAAGHAHSLALKSDGTVVAWGFKDHGQSTVPTNLRGVIAISAGSSHNLALKSDGTVVAWGGGNFDGEITVPANLSGIVAIAAGGAHSLALKSDGTTVAWGSNNFGQITIPDDLSGVIAIAARGHNSLALKFDGTIVAWGNNYSGQNEGPHSFGPVVAIAAAYNHSLALKSNGTVLHWGEDYFGAQSTLPESLSGVISIAAGYYHSLALKSDGTVVAWGAGGPGQSNSIDHGQSIVPSKLIGAIAIAAGGYHSLALKLDGTVVAWGAGRPGQSGDPHYGQSIVPSNLNSVIAVAAGYYHSLALKSDGTVVAWGAGRPGQSGDPHHGQSIVPSNLNSVIAVAAGYYHSLALKSDGTVVAWGAGRLGQSPNYGQSEVPGNLTKVVAIAAGGYHSLALKSDGTVVAWGAGRSGQSGDPHYGQSILSPDLSGVIAIAAGGSYSLALVRDMPTTTIDFETMPGASSFLPGFRIPEPSKLTTQYSSKGVVFSSIAGYAAVVTLGDGHATSGINGIGSATASGELTYSPDSPIKVTFVSPVDPNLPGVTSYASIRIDNAHSTPELSVVMEAYGLAGNLIGSAAVADSSNAVVAIRTPGIHMLLLYGNGTTAFDDLTFERVRTGSTFLTSISPRPVPARNARQWLSFSGQGFSPQSQVTLRTGNEVFVIPSERTEYVNTAEIRIFVNVTDKPAPWTAEVKNPDGEVASRGFEVVNGAGQVSAKITGAVKDNSGQPLGSTTVSAVRPDQVMQSVLTGSDGSFHFDNLPAGAYSFTASKTGYENQTQLASLWDTLNIQFRLAPEKLLPETEKVNELRSKPIRPGSEGSSLKVFYQRNWLDLTPESEARKSINPQLPTVVLSHGWVPEWDPYDGIKHFSWQSFAQQIFNVMNNSGHPVNILGWHWPKAAFGLLPPEQNTVGQGYELGKALYAALGSEYKGRIHFVGHSLGTLVNASAANFLHGDKLAIESVASPVAICVNRLSGST